MYKQDIQLASNGWNKVIINKYPDYCAFCQAYIQMVSCEHFVLVEEGVLHLSASCPKCKKLFICEYREVQNSNQHAMPAVLSFQLVGLTQPEIKTKEYDDILNNNFPKVVQILKQAEKAEKTSLTELAGMGYRKALEFLIKDFVLREVEKDSAEAVKIKEMRLSNVIDHHIQHEKIKAFSKRAVWLGNDEVHYDRRWAEKDIKDLKNLVDLTISHITTEIMGEQYIFDMPD